MSLSIVLVRLDAEKLKFLKFAASLKKRVADDVEKKRLTIYGSRQLGGKKNRKVDFLGLLIWRKSPQHIPGEASISVIRDFISYVKTTWYHKALTWENGFQASRNLSCRLPGSCLAEEICPIWAHFTAKRENNIFLQWSHGHSFPGKAGKYLHMTGHKLYSWLTKIFYSPGKCRGNFLHMSRHLI